MSKIKSTYVLLAEKALGKELPPGAVVHHIDRNRKNNRNNNLVILSNNMEHMQLHKRLRIQNAGGDWRTERLCRYCKKIGKISLFKVNRQMSDGSLSELCLACHKKNMEEKRLKKEKERLTFNVIK